MAENTPSLCSSSQRLIELNMSIVEVVKAYFHGPSEGPHLLLVPGCVPPRPPPALLAPALARPAPRPPGHTSPGHPPAPGASSGLGLGAVLQPAKVSSAWSAHYRRKTEINCGNYIEERQETGWKVRSVDKNRRCDKKQKVP